jgi:hypothetical protein
MIPSSRTPEGEPNSCPICGHEVRVDVSYPAGDAPCPHCGHLLWFGEFAGRNVAPQTAIGRTFSHVDKREPPALVAIQFVGLVAAITATVLLIACGVVGMVALVVRIMAS